MSKKFTIVSRDDFNKLYKFGSLKVLTTYIIDNENATEKLSELLQTFSFEDEYGYLILKFNYEINKKFDSISITECIKIIDVDTVYTLSKDAQQWYSIKFNPKIKFQVIENFDINTLLKLQELKDIQEGIHAFFKMNDFTEDDVESVKKSLPSEFDLSFLEYLKVDNYLKVEFQNFYLDLLLYKRENKFPPEDVSFIYDIFVLWSLKNRDLEKVNLYKAGDLKISSSDYGEIVKSLHSENKKQTMNLNENIEFIIANQQNENINNDELVIGALFLKIKSLLDEDYGKKAGYKKVIEKIVSDFKNKYNEQLQTALYLIGLFFGYKNLYDDYYDFWELSIFKELDINKEMTYSELKEHVKQLENENEILREKENTQALLSSKMKSEEGSLLENSEPKLLEDTYIKGGNEKVNNKLETILENNQQSNINHLTDNKSHEDEFHSLDSIPDDIIDVISMPHSKLQKMAKDKGVKSPTGQKYSNTASGKRALINEILKKDNEKLLLPDNKDDEAQISEVDNTDGN